MIEGIIGSISTGTAPDIGRVAQERFGKPQVAPEIQAKAAEIAGANVQGQELIDLARSKMAAETQAAAAADSASREQKRKLIEGRAQLGETVKKAGGDVLTFGKAALGMPLSEKEVQTLDEVGKGERKLPIQEAASAFADMARQMVEAAKHRGEVLKARGELKNIPLSRDRALVERMEASEQKVVEAGLRIVAELDKEPRTLDDLKEANAIHHGFDRAERAVRGALGRLAGRLTKRYPTTAAEIEAKRLVIEGELEGKKVEVTEAGEVTMEQKVTFIKETVDRLGIEGDDTKKWFAEKLGLRSEAVAAEEGAGAELLTVADGSLADLLLSVRVEKAALQVDSAKSLEAAHEDPRVADEALSFALLEYSAQKNEEIAMHKLDQLQMEARALEQIRLAGEAAKLSRSELWQGVVDKLDGTVSLLAKNVAVVGRVAGRAAGATGMVLGGAVTGVGAIMMIPGALVAGAGVLTGAGGYGAERFVNRAFTGLRNMIHERRAGRHEEREKQISDLERQKERIETKLVALRGGAAAGAGA